MKNHSLGVYSSACLGLLLGFALLAVSCQAVPLPPPTVSGSVTITYDAPPTNVLAVELWYLPANAPDYPAVLAATNGNYQAVGTNWILYGMMASPGLTNQLSTPNLPASVITCANIGRNDAGDSVRSYAPEPALYRPVLMPNATIRARP